MYEKIKKGLTDHYGLKNQSGKKYLKELEEFKMLNTDLEKPLEVTTGKQLQVLEPFNDGYLLRLFSQSGREFYRCFFCKKYNDIQLAIYKNYGMSGFSGFRNCSNRMGYSEVNFAYTVQCEFINKSELFPYIDFTGLKINGMRLMEEFYSADQIQFHTKETPLKSVLRELTLELLIKSGRKRLAELYVSECWNADIKKILKSNQALLKKPTASRIRLAESLGEVKYQQGMIQFADLYTMNADKIKKVMELCSWRKFYQYYKTQEKGSVVYKSFLTRSTQGFLSNYIDYRQINRVYGFSDFPHDFYKSKEDIRILQEKEKVEKYRNSIAVRSKGLFTVETDDVIIFPAPTPESIVEEGKMQHNCVAQFIPGYAAGNSDIYFLREKENIQSSFVTIEIKNGKLAQAESSWHKKPPKEVMPIINQLVHHYQGVNP